MNLNIHLGAHKTASSSMQRKFREICNDDYKSLNNLYYIDKKLSQTPFKNLMVRKAEILNRANKINQFIEKQNKECGINKFFISDEQILGKMLGHSKSLYPKASKFLEVVKKLQKDIELKCILFVRRQDALIESAYKFRAKQDLKSNINNFIKKINLERLSWVELAENFAKNNIKLEIYPYEFLQTKDSNEKLYNIFKDVLPNTSKEDFILKKTNFNLSDFTVFFIKSSKMPIAGYNKVKYGINKIFNKVKPKNFSELNNKSKFQELEDTLIERINILVVKFPDIRVKNINEAVRLSLTELLKNYNQKTNPFKLSDIQRKKVLELYREDNEKLFNKYITNDFGVEWPMK